MELATPADVSSWLEIVREVEPLFGPMPNFEATLREKIDERQALCERAPDGGAFAPVLGGLLIGGTPDHGWIRWLAVRSGARGRGVGRRLVEAAIARMAAAQRISLHTFREDNVEGRPARRLYARLGFVAGPLVEAQDAPRQRFDFTPRP